MIFIYSFLSDQVMVLKNEGMPKHNYPSERGPMEVKFSIRMPTSLSAEQRIAIQELLK